MFNLIFYTLIYNVVYLSPSYNIKLTQVNKNLSNYFDKFSLQILNGIRISTQSYEIYARYYGHRFISHDGENDYKYSHAKGLINPTACHIEKNIHLN